MSVFSEWFGFRTAGRSSTGELPEIYTLPVVSEDFVKSDLIAIYLKILTDVIERSHGIKDDQLPLMYDNCLKSASSDGLLTTLAKAMAQKDELFLVYEKAVGVIRPATQDEKAKIEADYKSSAKSSVGIFVSFKNFKRSDMLKFYLGLEYCTVASLYKSMKVSNAVQIKISDLRKSVSLTDADEALAQAQGIATSLAAGKDVILDEKDDITNAVPDLTATKETLLLVVQKYSFYLGLPDSYLIGEQTTGMGSTGENDMRAVERGLKAYFVSIVKPVVEALFATKLTYKTQDFTHMEGTMEVVKTFSLVDESLVTTESKKKIISKMLDIPEDEQPAEESEGGADGTEPDIQKQALNGAQVTSMVEVVSAVAAGTLPRDSAVEMMMIAFQLEQADADKLIGTAGKGFKPTKPEPTVAVATGKAPPKAS